MEIRSNLSSLMEHSYQGTKEGEEKRNPTVSSSGSGENQNNKELSTSQKNQGSNIKEKAEAVLIDVGVMGEFEDKKGLEQTTDVGIGPDIRYALTSKNPDFLKRILWGPLTVDEYRELKYRLHELETKKADSHNLLSGKTVKKNLIQTEDLKPTGEKPIKANQDKNMIDIMV